MQDTLHRHKPLKQYFQSVSEFDKVLQRPSAFIDIRYRLCISREFFVGREIIVKYLLTHKIHLASKHLQQYS